MMKWLIVAEDVENATNIKKTQPKMEEKNTRETKKKQQKNNKKLGAKTQTRHFVFRGNVRYISIFASILH
jgi:hypothetical protein